MAITSYTYWCSDITVSGDLSLFVVPIGTTRRVQSIDIVGGNNNGQNYGNEVYLIPPATVPPGLGAGTKLFVWDGLNGLFEFHWQGKLNLQEGVDFHLSVGEVAATTTDINVLITGEDFT